MITAKELFQKVKTKKWWIQFGKEDEISITYDVYTSEDCEYGKKTKIQTIEFSKFKTSNKGISIHKTALFEDSEYVPYDCFETRIKNKYLLAAIYKQFEELERKWQNE